MFILLFIGMVLQIILFSKKPISEYMYKWFDVRCVSVLAMYRSIEKVEANANDSRLGKLPKN